VTDFPPDPAAEEIDKATNRRRAASTWSGAAKPVMRSRTTAFTEVPCTAALTRARERRSSST